MISQRWTSFIRIWTIHKGKAISLFVNLANLVLVRRKQSGLDSLTNDFIYDIARQPPHRDYLQHLIPHATTRWPSIDLRLVWFILVLSIIAQTTSDVYLFWICALVRTASFSLLLWDCVACHGVAWRGVALHAASVMCCVGMNHIDVSGGMMRTHGR